MFVLIIILTIMVLNVLFVLQIHFLIINQSLVLNVPRVLFTINILEIVSRQNYNAQLIHIIVNKSKLAYAQLSPHIGMVNTVFHVMHLKFGIPKFYLVTNVVFMNFMTSLLIIVLHVQNKLLF